LRERGRANGLDDVSGKFVVRTRVKNLGEGDDKVCDVAANKRMLKESIREIVNEWKEFREIGIRRR